jgi:hypothetical protein
MADDGFGLSFAPFAGKQGYGDQGGGQLSPVQEAIQILSLRRPTVVGASAPGPNGLINPNAPGGPGGAGAPGGMDFSALLQTLLKQFGGQYQAPQMPKFGDQAQQPGGSYAPPQLPKVPPPGFDFGQGPKTPEPGPMAPPPLQSPTPPARQPGPSFPFPNPRERGV